MVKNLTPTDLWRGEFGKEWTQRNRRTPKEIDESMVDRFDVSFTDLARDFLGDRRRDLSILDVGSNYGGHLEIMRTLGFSNLYGVDILDYAIEEAVYTVPEAAFMKADAMNLPFDDDAFDLVYTSGLLIHIPPDNIGIVMSEICRCASKYVLGFEYYSEEFQRIDYRGERDVLWKADYPRLYEAHCEFSVKKEEQLHYQDGSGNVDSMFLLERS